MHTASYEFIMKPKESAGCHQTLSAQVGSGDETSIVLFLPSCHQNEAEYNIIVHLTDFKCYFLSLKKFPIG